MKFQGVIFLFIMGLLFFAASANSSILNNDREGSSVYFNKSSARTIDITQSLIKNQLSPIWGRVSRTANVLKCEFDLYEAIQNELQKHTYPVALKDFLILSRSKNYIDDPVVDALNYVDDMIHVKPKPISGMAPRKFLSDNTDHLKAFYDQYLLALKNRSCKSSTLKSLNSKIKSLYEESLFKRFKFKKLRYFHNYALKNNWITRDQYHFLMQAYTVKLHSRSFDYATYVTNKSIVRTQSPLYDRDDRSSAISRKMKGEKISLRQSLYQRYDYAQILIMADLLKKMKARFESSKIEIHRFGPTGELNEVIELAPMEIYYFAIDLLRKEMSSLKTNNLFQGKSPQYLDLIVAGFETGIIHSSEVEQLKLIEEIWNPTKTWLEKSDVWIRTFATLGSVFLPPPYGMIPILALVVIEAISTSRKSQGATDETIYRLF